MGRAKKLNQTEINLIKKHKNMKKSNRAIALLLSRSVNVVNYYLLNPDNYGTKKTTGRPRKIKARTEKMFLRVQKTAPQNARTLLVMTETVCNVRTVQRVLAGPLGMKYRKMRGTPQLNQGHKIDRSQFARDYSNMGDKWHKVIFSDEKKFNLDGPDGLKKLWVPHGQLPGTYNRNQQGGKKIMVWAPL